MAKPKINKSSNNNKSAKTGRISKKDPNAPERPPTAYNLFLNERIEEWHKTENSLSLKEYTAQVAKEWHINSQNLRKTYLNNAKMARDEYRKLVAEYKESDSYRNFLKESKSASGSVLKKRAKSISVKNQSLEAEGESSFLLPSSALPIFTDAFLAHNRNRERSLRALRNKLSAAEEEAALLAKHVESTNNAADRLREEVDKRSTINEALEEHLNLLQERVEALLQSLPSNIPPGLPMVPLLTGQLYIDLASKLSHLSRVLDTGNFPAYQRQLRQALNNWDIKDLSECAALKSKIF